MTEPAASRFEIGEEPHFPLHILRSMRAEVDALLGFLLSESKMETAHNGAKIRTLPTKPVRRGAIQSDALTLRIFRDMAGFDHGGLLEISLRVRYRDGYRRKTEREFQGLPEELPITPRR
jgi:hypothetical protein